MTVRVDGPTFKAGDRVRHRYADLAGAVKRGGDYYIKVDWDHYGLAVAALGTQADLVPADYLLTEDCRV